LILQWSIIYELLKKISTAAFFTTVFIGSLPFAYAMEQDAENKTIQLKKLPFVDIKAEPIESESLRSFLSVKDSGDSQFRKLASGEAKLLTEALLQTYGVLVAEQKAIPIPLIKITECEKDAVKFKVAESNDTFRILNAEKATEKLQMMLHACTIFYEEKANESLKPYLEEKPTEAEPVKSDVVLDFEQEKARLQAALKEQEEKAIKQKQEEELAALRAQLVLQEEQAKQQALVAEQTRLRLEQEKAAAQQETIRMQQEAANQAQQQPTILGYTPQRIEHNVNTELTRGVESANNFLKTGKWHHKKHKKHGKK
jgi:hypothetical protein